ncbi:hypothetical protein [Mycobacterium sp. URHB0021]
MKIEPLTDEETDRLLIELAKRPEGVTEDEAGAALLAFETLIAGATCVDAWRRGDLAVTGMRDGDIRFRVVTR